MVRDIQSCSSKIHPLSLTPFPICFQQNQGDRSPATRLRCLCCSWPKHTTTKFKMLASRQMCWHTPAIPAFKRLRCVGVSPVPGHIVKPLKVFKKTPNLTSSQITKCCYVLMIGFVIHYNVFSVNLGRQPARSVLCLCECKVVLIKPLPSGLSQSLSLSLLIFPQRKIVS